VGILKVNSLARINMCREPETDEAREAVKDLRNKWGHPLHNNFLFDLARLIELIYASERTIQLLDDKGITQRKVRVPLTTRAGRGAGSVEAPRGTLVHSYEVDENARLSYVDIVVPTESNNAAINMAIKDVARKCISAGRIGSELYQRVETMIRAFDPCISCAHHTIEIIRKGEIDVEQHSLNHPLKFNEQPSIRGYRCAELTLLEIEGAYRLLLRDGTLFLTVSRIDARLFHSNNL